MIQSGRLASVPRMIQSSGLWPLFLALPEMIQSRASGRISRGVSSWLFLVVGFFSPPRALRCPSLLFPSVLLRLYLLWWPFRPLASGLARVFLRPLLALGFFVVFPLLLCFGSVRLPPLSSLWCALCCATPAHALPVGCLCSACSRFAGLSLTQAPHSCAPLSPALCIVLHALRSVGAAGVRPFGHPSPGWVSLGTFSRAVVVCVSCVLSGFAARGGRCCLAPGLVPCLWPAVWLSGVPRGHALVRRASSGPIPLGAPVGCPVAVMPSPTGGHASPDLLGKLTGHMEAERITTVGKPESKARAMRQPAPCR